MTSNSRYINSTSLIVFQLLQAKSLYYIYSLVMNNLGCSICKSAFNFDNVPKVLKNCNHSVCLSCLNKQKICSIDKMTIDLQKYGLKNFLTNTQILEQLRFQSHKKNYQRIQEKQQVKKRKPKDKIQIENCLLHSKPADVVCIQEGEMICSTCALFGEHKGHKICSYDQLQIKISELTQDALSIYDTIKAKQESLSKQVINQYIENQFKEKRNIQAKNIRQTFQKTIQNLRKIQKMTVSNLDLIVSRRIKVLKQTINCGEMNQKIKQWYLQVQKLGNIAQDVFSHQSIKEALKFLYINSEESFLCKNGQYLSIQVSALQSTIKNKIDQQIQSSRCIFNDKFIDSLGDICKFDQKFDFLLKQNQLKKNKMFSGLKTTAETQHHKQNQYKTSLIQKNQRQNQDILLDTQTKNFCQNNNDLDKLGESIVEMKKGYLGYEQRTQHNISLENSIVCQIQSLNLSSFQELAIFQHNDIKQSNQNSQITTSRDRSKKNIQNKSNKKVIKNQNHYNYNKHKINVSSIDSAQKEVLKNVLDNHQIKRKKKIEIPEKYRQIWEDIKSDKLDQVDLTGAQLGDSVIISLIEIISKTSKIKQLKLIRNKLTDQIIHDLLTYLRNCNVTNVNLSQNGFTQKCLQTIEHYDMGSLKTITLSLNKINGRKVKDRLQALRQRGITVSI